MTAKNYRPNLSRRGGNNRSSFFISHRPSAPVFAQPKQNKAGGWPGCAPGSGSGLPMVIDAAFGVTTDNEMSQQQRHQAQQQVRRIEPVVRPAGRCAWRRCWSGASSQRLLLPSTVVSVGRDGARLASISPRI
jgi:hypothetical protein